eukprot:11910586-Ditylum_brightwellii.AAC.1
MGDNMAEQVMKAIINAEDMANMWRKISYTDKGKRDNNITLLLISESWLDINTINTPEIELEDLKKSQQLRTVDLPEEILHYLTIQNRCYFVQAKGTPFTLPSLSKYFDWASNSPVSEMVLKDEFNSNELDEVQKLFIQHCKLEPVDEVISTKITKAQ